MSRGSNYAGRFNGHPVYSLRSRSNVERKLDRRPRGIMLRAIVAAHEVADDWDDLTKEERIERLAFIRECAGHTIEQLSGEAYWLKPPVLVGWSTAKR
jgi:hypothetical protein